MIGALDPSRREVTVVGAGFAGLVAAYFLDRAGWEVTLLEASERAGGLIRTLRTPHGIAESAAHSFLASPALQGLCRELAVELIPVNAPAKARYVLRDGKMRRFPLKPSEAISALWRACTAVSTGDRATLADWGERHLGRPAVDYLLTPFVRGIYASSPAEIAIDAAFPSWVIPAGRSLLGSRLFSPGAEPARKEPSSMMAPAKGMESLIGALSERLRTRLGSRFRLRTEVTELPEALNLILAVPAGVASRLLQSIDAGTAEALARIRYAPLVSVTAFAERKSFSHPPSGVGVLVPEIERRDALGILFNSSAFSGRVHSPGEVESFTVMLGGTSSPRWVEAPEDKIRECVAREMREILGFQGDLLHLDIHRSARAIPRYGPELLDIWEQARQGWCRRPGRVLFGNYTGQVSLRGMVETLSSEI